MNNFIARFAGTAKVWCTMILFFHCFGDAAAQVTATEKKWNFLTDVYLVFPYMDGEVGIGNKVTAQVDANPGDIFSKLQMAGMIYLEARHKKWAFASDIIYMDLNQEITPGTLLHSGNVTAKQFVWEPAVLYRLNSFIEAGAGGRLNSIEAGVDGYRNIFPSGLEEVNAGRSETWFDPILITRLATDINDKWLFQFRGDLGGFGVGSDFTWQLQGYAGYRFSKLFQLTAGYRILSMDYDKGKDAERFIYNVDIFGPVLRFGFNF